MPPEVVEGYAVHELEFLPEDYIRARFQRRIGFIRSWLLLAIGMAMVLWSLQMGTWVRDARAELQALRGTGSAMEPDVEKIRTMRAEARSYNRRIDLVRALHPTISASEVVADLVDLLPQDVGVETLDLDYPEAADADRATLRLRGTAPDETTVTQTAAALDASPRFEHAMLVESKRVSERTGGGRAFVITANVMPTPAGKEQ